VDPRFYDVDFENYLLPESYDNPSRLRTLSVRGSGPLPSLPWGKPYLTFGVERRLLEMPEVEQGTFQDPYGNRSRSIFYAQEQTTDSLYVEGELPLVAPQRYRWVHELSAQLAGRIERYTVEAGTFGETEYVDFGFTIYNGPTRNGLPFTDKDTYSSTDHTLGLKYRPIPQVLLRASHATAFVPAMPSDLMPVPASTGFVSDPSLVPPAPIGCITSAGRVFCPAQVSAGGNPALKPQNSRSFNAGLVWEPQQLKGLRLSVDYRRIRQFDAFATLSPQQVVDLESIFPERVTRDTNGRITAVDARRMNLFGRDTRGWDLGADYRFESAFGVFTFRTQHSLIDTLKSQLLATSPAYDAAGYSPAELPGGGGGPKHKANASLIWQRNNWMGGWSVSHFGSYKQSGAVGGPQWLLSNTSPDDRYLIAQGGDTIPSQAYHDVFMSYTFDPQPGSTTGAFGARAASILSGVNLRIGIKNLFDKLPPLDTAFSHTYYSSPYGSARLRSYSLSLVKDF
jgi:iron complex outermembrane receptor protein